MKNSKEIEDFEKSLNGPENTQIKYNIDRGIEASVRYDYLVENYGKETVDSLVDDFLELFDTKYFYSIKSKLDEIK